MRDLLRKWTIKICPILCVFLTLVPVFGKKEDESYPLGCISLTVAEDAFDQSLAQAFEERMDESGYRHMVAYCDNDVEKQIKHINNFITLGAKLIFVKRVANATAYEDVFRKAKEQGCIIVTLDSNEASDESDINVQATNLFQGMRACEVIKEFLNREYPDAEAGSVTMLLLEVSFSAEDIQISAGYKLIGERFLRYYDSQRLDYIHEDSDEIVYYCDASGNTHVVEEKTGGLLLGADNMAILNPYYDARIDLQSATYKNVETNLEAQAAIDAFMSTPNGRELKIVGAVSGMAGVGAAERLKFYEEAGTLSVSADKLAVIGSGDMQINHDLLSESLTNSTLLRGYVYTESATSQINSLVEMALSGQQGTYTINSSNRSSLSPKGTFYGIVTVIGTLCDGIPEEFYELIRGLR